LDAFDLKVLVRTLLMPPALPWLLLLVGLVLVAWRAPAPGRSSVHEAPQGFTRRRTQGLSLLSLGLLLSYLSSIGPVADLLAARLEQGLSRWEPAAAEQSPQAIVILGGGSVRDGANVPDRERLKHGTLQRVVEGARVARVSGLPVLVSGGVPQGLRQPEAHLMRETLQQTLGVQVRWVEDRSRDTADNARMSAVMLREAGLSRVILVTQAYHMPRAQRAFEAAGLNVTAAPHDFMAGSPAAWHLRDLIPRAARAEVIALCLHEWMGRLWYDLRGHF
jgi:uncharacterized SAM-binding protein YcdF (DUF218 family)